MEEVENLAGVGEKVAEKLRAAGYTDLMALAAASASELNDKCALGEETANKIINAARGKLKMGFELATEVLKRRESIGKISTLSLSLNNLLGGGIETQAITECYGAFGSGKSQLAHQLAVSVQLPKEQGGLGGKAIFIDTEQTFRPERIIDMASALGLDPKQVLENILVARAYNSDHQILLAEKAEEIIKTQGVKLLIIDSLTANFRSDYTGRGQLADRQQTMNKHLHKIQRLADVYNIAIYVTNQVMSRPDILFGDPTVPIGGHVLGHQCVDPNSLLQLSDGTIIEAKDSHNPLEFKGIDFGNLKEDQSRCNGVFRAKKDKIIEINHSLRVSPEHTVFKANGLDIVEVEAKCLKKGDYLVVPRKVTVKGKEVDLPEIDVERVVTISAAGAELIRKKAREKGISLKKSFSEFVGIEARQLRRVLNQKNPTRMEVIGKLGKFFEIDLKNFITEVETNKHKKIKMPGKLTAEISQILGYFIGDGSLCKNSIEIRDARKDVLMEYSRLFSGQFGLEGSLTKLKGKNCFDLTINNKYISSLLRVLEQDYIRFISQSSENCVKGFIRGIFDAEGSITDNKLCLSNKDKKLLEFVKLLLLRFGVHAKVNIGGDIYRLMIVRDLHRFIDNIGLTAKDKMAKVRQVSAKREVMPIERSLLEPILKKAGIKARKDLKYFTREYLERISSSNEEIKRCFEKILGSDIAFEKITSMTVNSYEGELVDLSIPRIENFIANGYVIHNSTYRVYLRKSKGEKRIARMIDSPSLPEGEAIFRVGLEGVRDDEEFLKSMEKPDGKKKVAVAIEEDGEED